MCVVSMVTEWHFQKPRDWWTQERWNDFQQIIPQVKEIDKAMGLPDCEQEEKLIQLGKLAQELGYDLTKIQSKEAKGSTVADGLQPAAAAVEHFLDRFRPSAAGK